VCCTETGSYLLQDENGQITETHSVLQADTRVWVRACMAEDSGRAEYVGATDEGALKLSECCRIEAYPGAGIKSCACVRGQARADAAKGQGAALESFGRGDKDCTRGRATLWSFTVGFLREATMEFRQAPRGRADVAHAQRFAQLKAGGRKGLIRISPQAIPIPR